MFSRNIWQRWSPVYTHNESVFSRSSACLLLWAPLGALGCHYISEAWAHPSLRSRHSLGQEPEARPSSSSLPPMPAPPSHPEDPKFPPLLGLGSPSFPDAASPPGAQSGGCGPPLALTVATPTFPCH